MNKLASAALGVASIALVASSTPASAASDDAKFNYKDVAGHSGSKKFLQANVWLGAGQSFSWKTSSKYGGTTLAGEPSKAKSIYNKVNISVTGVGVSLGNASGGTSSDKDFAASWTNNNAVIADLAGTNKVSNNFYLYITGKSTAKATIPYFGTPRSAAVSVQKWA